LPVEVQWYDAPHIIVAFWSGEATAQDMQDFALEAGSLMAEAEAPIYIVADTGQVTRPYMNMADIRATLKGVMDDERLVMFVGYNVKIPIVNFLISVLTRTFSLKTRTFDSWESAQTFLDSLDTGLDFSRIPNPPHTLAEAPRRDT
jgi:hypothetical protein